MVGCDNAACRYEWYHLECVGLETPPEGSWCVTAYHSPEYSLINNVGIVLIAVEACRRLVVPDAITDEQVAADIASTISIEVNWEFAISGGGLRQDVQGKLMRAGNLSISGDPSQLIISQSLYAYEYPAATARLRTTLRI